jgi:hypothetical protein
MVHIEAQGTSSANHRDIQNNIATMHKWSHKEDGEREREQANRTSEGRTEATRHPNGFLATCATKKQVRNDSC